MAVFSGNVAFANHFMATCPPLSSHSVYRSASGIGYTNKKYLKLWAIQLAIHSIIGEYVDYKKLWNCGKLYASTCIPSQAAVLKIGIAKYL